MKININWKKTGLIFFSVIAILYVLFLALPLVLSPIANSYCRQVEEIIKTSSGLDAKIDGIGITTSPKFAFGIKIKGLSLFAPNGKTKIIEVEDAKADLRLLPLIIKKVQLGNITAEEINVNIVLKNDGIPEIIDYFPKQNQDVQPMTALPFGLKLSNHLPNIYFDEYKLNFIDKETKKTYFIDGDNLEISDFVLNKKIKIAADGQIVFDKKIISNYDIKIFNKIMPDILLDDLVFPKEVKIEQDKSSQNNFKINIIDIFETINKNGLKADINCDIKTSGTFKKPIQKGFFEVGNMTVLSQGKQLPKSHAKLIFKGSKTDIDSVFYTSFDTNEKTQLRGNIKSGKNRSVDLTLRSNAKFNNIIRLIDSIAQSFGKNDLKTITATGGIDADFNIKSDLKNITSTGHLKVPSA